MFNTSITDHFIKMLISYHFTFLWGPLPLLPSKRLSSVPCGTLYNCSLHCTTRYRAQSVRRQQRKRTSQESEMVTYKHVNEVVRNRCVKHQAKRVDSRDILFLIATLAGALIILITKQTNTRLVVCPSLQNFCLHKFFHIYSFTWYIYT